MNESLAFIFVFLWHLVVKKDEKAATHKKYIYQVITLHGTTTSFSPLFPEKGHFCSLLLPLPYLRPNFAFAGENVKYRSHSKAIPIYCYLCLRRTTGLSYSFDGHSFGHNDEDQAVSWPRSTTLLMKIASFEFCLLMDLGVQSYV